MNGNILGRVVCLTMAALWVFTSAPLHGQPRNTQPEAIFFRATISTPGSYILGTDLAVNLSGGAGITITASGVTLDLNGHEIKGPGGKVGTGIMINGAHGVKVTNGNLSNLAFGIVVNNSNNVVLRDLQVRGQGLPIVALPPETGIMIVQSKNVVVEDNAIYNTGLGVFVRGGGSWGNRIAGNTITANTNGALGICYNPAGSGSEGPRGDLVSGNLISGFPTGISISEGSRANIFRGNTIAFVNAAIDDLNGTNDVTENVSIQLP